MAEQRLAIVGGGAKAAAICAKAACLRQLAGLPIDVTVFERSSLGASWDGAHGYTDGEQQLCTPAERDVGFPYSGGLGKEIDAAMQARFSWMTFAVATGLYPIWVDKGRPRPSHKQFADYLRFCLTASEARIVFGDVTRLNPTPAGWDIEYRDRDSGENRIERGFHGVVATGTGPQGTLLEKVDDPDIYDGVTFWKPGARAGILAVAAQSTEPVIIVGSGGTAAATAAALVRSGVRNQIIVLGNQAALYARADSFFENRSFRDPGFWSALSVEDRTAFTDRLTRGTVWSNVVDLLAQAPNVDYWPGTAQSVRHEPVGDASGDLVVVYCTSAAPKTEQTRQACLVVDATGFDAAWFAHLLPDALRDEVLDVASMRKHMSADLGLPLSGVPPLHAPMLSQVVGPAYTSLMALGELSTAVLERYVRAALT